MGRKAVGPVCCIMHVKEPRTLIVKEKGLAPVFLDSCLEHPNRVDMCALQIFCVINLDVCNERKLPNTMLYNVHCLSVHLDCSE